MRLLDSLDAMPACVMIAAFVAFAVLLEVVARLVSNPFDVIPRAPRIRPYTRNAGVSRRGIAPTTELHAVRKGEEG